MDSGLLLLIFTLLLAACVVVPLAAKAKLGAVLGYLAAGVLIGPFGLRLIEDSTHIMHIAEFGVVMMLFVIGLELEPKVLWRLKRAIIGLGGLQVCATTLAFMGLGLALGYGWQMSLAAGMALSLSSTALALQILEERGLMQTEGGETAFSVLLFQDIAVIPILILMPLLALNGLAESAPERWVDTLPALVRVALVAGVIALVVVAGRYGSRHVFRMVAKTKLREVFTATSLALVVGITLLMQLVGVSPALGAFVAGVVLANSEYRHTLHTDIEPFKGLLLGLFFISVGMGIDFSLLADAPMNVAAAVVALIAIKALILFAAGRFFGLQPSQNYGLALVLAQGGEFAFVLFQFAGGLGILPPEEARFLTLTVALSIAATPLLMLLYHRYIVPRFMSMLPARYDEITEQNAVIIAGFGRFGQVVGRFVSAQRVPITVLEKDPDQIEMLRKFGFTGYYGDASRLDMLHAAGAAKARLLVIAVDDADTCVEIATLARAHFPHLKIFARARNRAHAYALHKAGVDTFKRELFDSSLSLAQEVMVALGRKESDMMFKAEQFRRHDEATLEKSFEFFTDEPQLVNFARQRRGELERILQEDIKN